MQPERTSDELSGQIAEMVRRIVRASAPEKIVLFGSHARGEASPDSDVDLLVVADVGGEGRRAVAARIDRLLLDIPVPTDIVVVTPADVETFHDQIGTIIEPAFREGRVLYDRAA